MHVRCGPLLVVFTLIVPAAASGAQTAPDPSGHWQGTLQAPGMEMPFEIDLARSASGQLGGTISIPAQKIKGLPLTKVAMTGTSISFQARSDQPFTGVVADDRQSITGEFLIAGNSLPFTMTRTGDAAIQPPPTSQAITKPLEGRWTATMMAEGTPHHLVLTLVNNADGTSSGRIVNLDQGGLELPLRITQKGASITLDLVPLAGTFSATLNEAGTELAGIFLQGPVSAQVTFRKEP
jgi:hypothetical protein